METRTELILLQRTMVVVEGVAQKPLSPHLNIWDVAKPIVERLYQDVDRAAKAVMSVILPKTVAQVLTRFGPRLPGLVEAALIRQSASPYMPSCRARRGPAQAFSGLSWGPLPAWG